MKKFILGFVIAASFACAPLFAQSSLSSQVLRLLTRANTWTALQIFDTPNGGIVQLSRQSAPLGTRTDRLENIGGSLYFNGTVLASSSSAGTVTSVGLTAPAIFSVANSPVTSSGTIAVTLATESANTIFAGPTTGSAATPTFRSLVAADIPDLSSTYVTPAGAQALSNKTGNISQWTNDVGYLTSSTGGGTNITIVGTVTTGTWNANIIAGLYGGTGVANSGKTITLGGNINTASSFTTSGGNALTLTTTGSTNVTLPTSGTLVNSAVTTLSSLVSVGTITSGVWNGTAVDATHGGTAQTTWTQGDILYASASNTLSKLAKSASATRYLSNTGSSNNPAWAQVDLTNGVTGVLPAANGGLATNISAVTDGQLLVGKTSDHSLNLATITGTANQILVTNGAGAITLSTPQNIGTGSTPQFARIGLGVGAGASAAITTTGQLDLGYFDNGNSGASKTINWNSGSIEKLTLTANTTLTLNNPITGAVYTLVLIQDGTGSRTVTWPGSVQWQGGSAPTLTATAGKADICSQVERYDLLRCSLIEFLI